MERVITKMRADFDQVASARIAGGLWSREDAGEASKAIKAAIDADDRGLIMCWARWLAVLSARDLAEASALPPEPPEYRECRSCAHFGRPGLSDGYCSGREDLAQVYGANHPLRALPADKGVSCARWKGRT